MKVRLHRASGAMAGVTAKRAPEEIFSRMGYSRDASSGASGSTLHQMGACTKHVHCRMAARLMVHHGVTSSHCQGFSQFLGGSPAAMTLPYHVPPDMLPDPGAPRTS